MSLYDQLSVDSIAENANNILKNVLNCYKSAIYIYDLEKKELYGFNEENDILKIESGMGIIGRVLKTGQLITVNEPHKDPLYNQNIDLDTNNPIYTLPIKNKYKKVSLLSIDRRSLL